MVKEKKYVTITIDIEEYDFGKPEDVDFLRGCDNIFFMGGKLITDKDTEKKHRLPISYQFFVDKKTRKVKFVKEI